MKRQRTPRDSNPHWTASLAVASAQVGLRVRVGDKALTECARRDSNPHWTASRTAAATEVGLHARDGPRGDECTRRDSNPHLTASETAAATELGYACVEAVTVAEAGVAPAGAGL